MNRTKSSKKLTILQGSCYLQGEGYDSYIRGDFIGGFFPDNLHLSDLVPALALEEVRVDGIQRRRQGKWRITVEFEPDESEESAAPAERSEE